MPEMQAVPIADSVRRETRSRKRASFIAAVLAAMVFTLVPRWASAQTFPYVRTAQTSNYVTRIPLTLAAGTYTFKTANVSANGNPVIHLLKNSPLTDVKHDDDSGGAPNASMTVTIAAADAGAYTLIVRAFSAVKTGTCDILQNGSTIYTSVFYGGNFIDVPTGTNYIYETVLTLGGAGDTYLYALNSSGAIVAMDDDGGVGLASRITGSNIRYVVLSTYSPAYAGLTNFYVNDKNVTDSDGDGLGNLLEAGLNTCAQPTCTNVVNGKDTDHDGLTDMAEVFGVDDPTNPQLLAKWGANPRHKDIFIEVDWIPDGFPDPTVRPFDQNLALQIASMMDLNQALGVYVLNPDQQSGINIHMDVGIDPSASEISAGETRYGSWGGSAALVGTDGSISPESPPNLLAVRKPLFRHARMFSGGGGQTDGINPSVPSFGWGGSPTDNDKAAFLHELGHTMNLDHFGHASWGTANCKPTYVSTMNYAFTYQPNTGFSSGYYASIPIDPAAVVEIPAFPSNRFPNYLANSPFFFGFSGQNVDWNRNGSYDGLGQIRAPATWAPGTSCAAFFGNQQVVSQGTSPVNFDTPKLVKYKGRLYLFSVTNGRNIQYSQGPIGADNDTGSCLGPASACVNWSAPIKILTSEIHAATGLSVASWNNGLLMTYKRTDGVLISRYSTTVDASGNPTNWSAETVINTLDTAVGTGPELTIMYVNSALFGGATEVAAIFGSVGGSYYVSTSPALGGPWTTKLVYTTADTTMAGSVAPSIVSWPNRGGQDHSAIGTSCGTFIDPSQNVRFYCYQKSTNRWQDLSSTMYPPQGMPKSATRTGLAYHVLRNHTGSPVGGNSWNGQFWMNVVPVNADGTNAVANTYVSNQLTTANPPSTSTTFVASGLFWDQWSGPRTGMTIGLYEDETISALKGVTIVYDDTMRFLPYADGSFPAVPLLKDGNDWQVIERGICAGIQGSNTTAFCGASNQWGY